MSSILVGDTMVCTVRLDPSLGYSILYKDGLATRKSVTRMDGLQNYGFRFEPAGGTVDVFSRM